MIRPKGKAQKIADRVMRGKSQKIEAPPKQPKVVRVGPYLTH